MIRLPDVNLDAQTAAKLAGYQAEVDAAGSFPRKVEEAKRLFSLRNKPSNAVFSLVRKKLTEMCSGAMRCVYCEDSARDQVEHMAPKDFYPERVFRWDNYVYACGRCNRPKNNKYAVFARSTGLRVDLQRRAGDIPVPPEDGDPLLLNPRLENAFGYMQLDLLGTFYFVEIAPAGSRDFQRANYTIELLGLNDRDELPVARADAYGNYRARLREYVHHKQTGAAALELDRLREGILQSNHPTVWREMVRQQNNIPELKVLFDQAPEAKNWV
jgi:uncharacterized protein (TIGR02646 family)